MNDDLMDRLHGECATLRARIAEHGGSATPVEQLLLDLHASLGERCPAASLKDHEFREAVNELRDLAVQYGQTQQLRERMAYWLRSFTSRLGVTPLGDQAQPRWAGRP